MDAEAHRTRILFVDDETSIRLTLPPVLEQAGFEVQVAETVSDAMFEINSHPFDVLISDLNIGEEGDGFLVTSAMRQVQPDCITFILTGYPAFETALQAIHGQVDDYLVKPVEIEALIRTVRDKLAHSPAVRFRYKELASLLKENIDTLAPNVNKTRTQKAHTPEQAFGQFTGTLIEVLEKKNSSLDRDTLRAATRFGRLRKRQGFSATRLAAEFSSFQENIYALIQNNLQVMNTGLLLPDLRRLNSSMSQLLAKAMEGLCGQAESKSST
jgi:ActR/RegA family two-component response regulator